MLLQVLGQSERLEAEDADVLLDRGMGSDVSPEREPGGVGFVAPGDFAFEGSLHFLQGK